MNMYFKNGTIRLNKKEVRSTKKLITQFISNVKKEADNNLSPTYYFTLLMMMHVMSQELLNDFDEATLTNIMNRLGADINER